MLNRALSLSLSQSLKLRHLATFAHFQARLSCAWSRRCRELQFLPLPHPASRLPLTDAWHTAWYWELSKWSRLAAYSRPGEQMGAEIEKGPKGSEICGIELQEFCCWTLLPSRACAGAHIQLLVVPLVIPNEQAFSLSPSFFLYLFPFKRCCRDSWVVVFLIQIASFWNGKY